MAAHCASEPFATSHNRPAGRCFAGRQRPVVADAGFATRWPVPPSWGISDGANLGVAAVMLYFGGTLGLETELPLSGSLAVILAAFGGAACILGLILYFSAKLRNNVMLLIVGIMIGYLASSLISVLNYYASTDKVHAFVMWGLGNFSGVSLKQLPCFLLFSITGLLLALLLIKPLNALLLGEMYAANLGIKVKHVRMWIFVLYRIAYGHHHRLLRPHLFYRPCRAACGPSDARLFQPPAVASRHTADRRLRCSVVQPATGLAGDANDFALKRNHTDVGCACNSICNREPEKYPIF